MTNRTATTGAPIPLTFVKLIDVPAMPDLDYAEAIPFFESGEHQLSNTLNLQDSNKPLIWSDIYQNPGLTAIGGALLYGASHADYALKTVGTGLNPTNGNQFDQYGTIDGALFGYSMFAHDNPNMDIYFFRQQLGMFTGGSTDVAEFSALETDLIVMGKDVDATGSRKVIASLASTVDDPEALLLFNPIYEDGQVDQQDALKLGLTGSLTKISLYQTAAELSEPIAACRDATNHFIMRLIAGGGGYALTKCVENTYGTYTGSTHWTPLFSDPDLPASYAAMRDGSDPNFSHIHTYGTDQGFLIGYKKLNGSDHEPKFILVDMAWTTVQHITATAGDATATTILAQGVGTTDESMISMMMEGGYVWLLGGTSAAPLIVETSDAPAPEPDAGDDDTLTIRCWPFSLDDHDFGVFRLGASETLVFDLKTRQWAEWRSPDRTNFRAHIGTNWVGMTETLGDFATDVVAGDDVTGVLWILDPTYGEDDRTDTSSDPFPRMVIGAVPLDGRDTAPCGAVQLTASLGAPALTGATVTLRTSDDFGHSYVSHGSQTITAGAFDQILEWRALGLMRAPGRIFELSDTGIKRIGRLSLR